MTKSKRIMVLVPLLLLLCLCFSSSSALAAEKAGEVIAYSHLDGITKHGNVILVKDDAPLPPAALTEAGIELGDIVTVQFLDQKLEMPVGLDFLEADPGNPLVRVKEDVVELAINQDDFASKYFAEKGTAEDGTITWSYKEGIEAPVTFTLTLSDKGTGELALHLSYTDERSDYADLTDEEFANFRPVTTTGMGEGALYRSSSPIDPLHNRNTYADAALEKAGVATIMNLVDSLKDALSYEGFNDTYYSTTNFIALSMIINFENDDFKAKLADGLRFFAMGKGPYAIHCKVGKDRTGVVAALLEGFMGASFEEIASDYMVTFHNYYGIEPGTPEYDQIIEVHFKPILEKIYGTDDLAQADLSQKTEEFFLEIGLTGENIQDLRENLGMSYGASQ